MTHSPLGLHVTYRCGHTKRLKGWFVRHYWTDSGPCAACLRFAEIARYFEERKS